MSEDAEVEATEVTTTDPFEDNVAILFVTEVVMTLVVAWTVVDSVLEGEDRDEDGEAFRPPPTEASSRSNRSSLG